MFFSEITYEYWHIISYLANIWETARTDKPKNNRYLRLVLQKTLEHHLKSIDPASIKKDTYTILEKKP
jgi:hypothetical protein